MRHFAAAELKLHTDFVAAFEKLFAMANFRQVIMLVDVHPELELLQLGAGGFLVLLLFGNIVTEFSERDDFTNRRVRRRGNLDEIETSTLCFAQGVGQLQDAELLTIGSENDPDFPGANPTVYTKLRLQIKSIS